MRFRLLGAAALVAGLACGDSTQPDRSDRYDWWLVAGADTLTFHWQPAELPVHIWVEDSASLPSHVSRGIGLWQNTVGTASWQAVTVADSTTAEVIVRMAPISAAPPIPGGAIPSGSCQGVTVLDTVASRFQLAIPIRINIEVIGGSPGSAQACIRRVVAHELGHSLGLFQHSPDDQDLMFAFPKVDAPSNRDANTVITLYMSPRNMLPTRVPAAGPAR